MCEILEQFHTYVPSKPQTKVLDVPGLDQRIAIEDLNFHKILLGGDQLTAARCRGGAAVRSDHRTSLERLDGMVPVCEDWHAKRIYLMVCVFVFTVSQKCTVLMVTKQYLFYIMDP